MNKKHKLAHASRAYEMADALRKKGGSKHSNRLDTSASPEELDVLSLSREDDDDAGDVERPFLAQGQTNDPDNDGASDEGEEEQGYLARPFIGEGGEIDRESDEEGEDDDEDDDASDDLEYFENFPLHERLVLGLADAGEATISTSVQVLVTGVRAIVQGVAWVLQSAGEAVGVPTWREGRDGPRLSFMQDLLSVRSVSARFSQVPQSDIELAQLGDARRHADAHAADDGDAEASSRRSAAGDPEENVQAGGMEWHRRGRQMMWAAAIVVLCSALSSVWGVGLTGTHTRNAADADDSAAGRFKLNAAMSHPLTKPQHLLLNASSALNSSISSIIMPRISNSVSASSSPTFMTREALSDLWQHTVCGDSNEEQDTTPTTAPLKTQRELQRERERGGDGGGGGGDTWWKDGRVACSPPFPQKQAAYGRTHCAAADALDISVVLPASNSLSPTALHALQRQLTALSLVCSDFSKKKNPSTQSAYATVATACPLHVCCSSCCMYAVASVATLLLHQTYATAATAATACPTR